MASGSYLALGQATSADPEWARSQDAYNASGATLYYLYIPDQVAELFTGLDLVVPGSVTCPAWQPHTQPVTRREDAATLPRAVNPDHCRDPVSEDVVARRRGQLSRASAGFRWCPGRRLAGNAALVLGPW